MSATTSPSPAGGTPTTATPSTAGQGSDLSLGELGAAARRHATRLAACALAGAFVAGAVSLCLRPSYVSEARVLIEDASSASSLVAASLARLPAGLGSLVGGAPATAAEMQVLRSRPVATSVVLPRGHDEVAPGVGLGLVTRVDDLDRLALWKEVWRRLSGAPEPQGSLAVEVESWDFPEDFEDPLRLRFRSADEVEVSIDRWFARHAQRVAFEPGRPFQYLEATLVLRPEGDLAGRAFRITHGGLQKTVEDFLENLEVQEVQRGTNVVRVAYPDSEARRSAEVVNAILSSYAAHNRRRLAQRAGKPAGFLEEEIERVRGELTAAEEELSAFGQRAGSIVLPEAAGELVGQLAQLDLERARLELGARSTEELLGRLRGGKMSLAELAGLEATVFEGSPTMMPLSGLLAERATLEAFYQPDWPELREANIAVAERRSALESALASRVEVDRRMSDDLDRIQSRYTAEMEDMPEAQVELLRFKRRVEAFSQIYLYLVAQLQEAKIREATAVPAVEVIESAIEPRRRSTPRLGLNLAVGLLLGFLAGIASAFVRELRRPLTTKEQLAALAGRGGGAALPRGRGLASAPLAVRDRPDGSFADALRSVRAGLSRTLAAAGARSVAVVSCRAGEGRSVVAANLAASLARAGARVLLVDADVRDADLVEWFGGARGAGLAEALTAGAPWKEALVATGIDGLELLGPGAPTPGLADVLAGPRGRALFAELAAAHDLVVFDTPPLGTDALGLIVAAACDATLFVSRAGRIPEREAEDALARLGQAGARLAASVLNDARG